MNNNNKFDYFRKKSDTFCLFHGILTTTDGFI